MWDVMPLVLERHLIKRQAWTDELHMRVLDRELVMHVQHVDEQGFPISYPLDMHLVQADLEADDWVAVPFV